MQKLNIKLFDYFQTFSNEKKNNIMYSLKNAAFLAIIGLALLLLVQVYSIYELIIASLKSPDSLSWTDAITSSAIFVGYLCVFLFLIIFHNKQKD